MVSISQKCYQSISYHQARKWLRRRLSRMQNKKIMLQICIFWSLDHFMKCYQGPNISNYSQASNKLYLYHSLTGSLDIKLRSNCEILKAFFSWFWQKADRSWATNFLFMQVGLFLRWKCIMGWLQTGQKRIVGVFQTFHIHMEVGFHHSFIGRVH